MSEDVKVIATFKDLLSRPARKAARAIDELGDEAAQTGRQLDKLDASVAGAGASVDLYAAAHEKAGGKVKEHKRQVGDLSKHLQRLDGDLKKDENSARRLVSRLQSIGRVISGIGMKIALIGTLAGAALSGIAQLAAGVQGLAAAAVAAVAALGPLTGIVGALFGMVPGIVVGMATMKLATAGLGEAFKAMTDPNATAAQIDKAMEGISNNARQLLATVVLLKREWKDFPKGVQDRLFAGTGPALRNVSNTLKPAITRNVNAAATGVNSVLLSFMTWMSSSKGSQTIDKMLQLGTVVFVAAAKGIALLMQAGMRLSVLATPLMKQMIADTLGWFSRIDGWIDRNEGRISSFFLDSWTHIKNWSAVIWDFAMGFYGIMKAAAPMVSWMGDGIGAMAENFRAWANDPATQAMLTKWFAEMIPVVRELLTFVGALLKAIWGLGDDRGGQFVETLQRLRTEVLPLLEQIFNNLANTDILDSVITALMAIGQILADPAVAQALADLVRWISKLIVMIAEWWNGLTPEQKKFVVKLVVTILALTMALSTAMPLLQGFGQLLMFAIANPLVLVVLLGIIAAIAQAIIINRIMMRLWEAFWPWLKPKVEWIGRKFLEFLIWLFNLKLALMELINKIREWLRQIGEFFESVVKFLVGLFDFGLKALRGLFGEFMNLWSSLPGIFRATSEAIGAALAPISILFGIMSGQLRGIMAGVRAVQNAPGSMAAGIGGIIGGIAGGLSGFFAEGGTIPGGSLAVVGERGPEAAVDAYGNIGLVGRNGPEFVNPMRDLSIVPNEFLDSLSSKDAGRAPRHAQEAVRALAMAGRQSQPAGPPVEHHDHLHLDGFSVRSDSDIDMLIEKWDAHQKNKRERR